MVTNANARSRRRVRCAMGFGVLLHLPVGPLIMVEASRAGTWGYVGFGAVLSILALGLLALWIGLRPPGRGWRTEYALSFLSMAAAWSAVIGYFSSSAGSVPGVAFWLEAAALVMLVGARLWSSRTATAPAPTRSGAPGRRGRPASGMAGR